MGAVAALNPAIHRKIDVISAAATDLQGMRGRSAIAADADLAVRQNRHVGVKAAAIIIDQIERIGIVGAGAENSQACCEPPLKLLLSSRIAY
jgi:hypothetical protein